MSRVFLCSMGANLAPELNFAKAREHVSKLGTAYYSRAVYTKPVNMESEHDFLNALMLLETSLDATALKDHFNTIEVALGRDRNDPQCAIKDRPIDIDILCEVDNQQNIWDKVPSYLEDTIPTLRGVLVALEQS
jgi:2-amino-4-hydroxy-6-hydroxymethyldihydropteridine diphosphokinase